MTLQFDSMNGRFSVDVSGRFGTDGHMQKALDEADRWVHAREPLKAVATLDPLARTFALAAQWEAAAYTFRRLVRILDGIDAPGPQIRARRERKAQRLAVATAHRIEEMSTINRVVVEGVARRYPGALVWLATERPELVHDALDAATGRNPGPAVSSMVLSAALCVFAREVIPHRLPVLGQGASRGSSSPLSPDDVRWVLPPREVVYGLPATMVTGIYSALCPVETMMPAIIPPVIMA